MLAIVLAKDLNEWFLQIDIKLSIRTSELRGMLLSFFPQTLNNRNTIVHEIHVEIPHK